MFTDFESMVAELARADVVFVGEQHDDPNTHRLEQALMSGLRRRRVAAAVSLEMFERDVQGTLDRYLSGAIGEAEFLKESRPWPRYATDYRPLVEMAKREGWPVVAANVPRRVASSVAKSGQAAIEQLPPADRLLMAAELQCPHDAYFARFSQAMNGHGAGDAKTAPAAPPTDDQRASTDRYYWSQCVKDETMAESLAKPSPIARARVDRSCTSTAPSTATSAPAPRSARAAASWAAGRGRLDAPRRRPRPGRTEGRGSRPRGLSGLYGEVDVGLAVRGSRARSDYRADRLSRYHCDSALAALRSYADCEPAAANSRLISAAPAYPRPRTP